MQPKSVARCLCHGMVLFAVITAGACTQRLPVASDSTVTRIRNTVRDAFNDFKDPLALAYDEDEESAEQLIAGGYDRLANGAAGRNSEVWGALRKLLRPTRHHQNVHTGAAVFLHQRLTPSGQQLLIYAEYRPSYIHSGRGELEIQVLGIDANTLTPIDLGWHVYDDFPLFYLNTRPIQQMLPHPQVHTLRIYNAQADAKHLSRFAFKYEIDGQMGEMTVQILDPDESSDTPRFPRLNLSGRNGIAD